MLIMYEERSYRTWVKANDLVKTSLSEKETDLLILAEKDVKKEAAEAIHNYRTQLDNFIKTHPKFKDSLEPLEFDRSLDNSIPNIVEEMLKAAKLTGVGPMAAVAGAMAEFIGRDLLEHSREIIIENGGDIYLRSQKTRTFGIFAGNSPLTGKLAFEIIPSQASLGICTSSGTVGHSLSFGKADAVIVISKNAALADAAATACTNLVKSKSDIEKSINFGKSIPGILALIVIADDKLGSWGKEGFQWSLKN